MTSLDRLKSALQSPWLPLALLLLALSTVFLFGGDRGYFYRCCQHNGISSQYLSIAVKLSPEHGFQRFIHRFIDDDGVVHYEPYNRFPIGGYASMKLATLPFSESPSAQLTAVRVLMLLFFSATAVLAYLSLCRLVSNRWIALTATLLSFSSFYALHFNDMISTEGMPDLFVVMLTFHGMIIFVQEGRFRQLLVKTCIALLMGWHVLALLLPFVIIGLAQDLIRARSAATDSPPSLLLQGKRAASALLRSRYLLLGIVALAFGLSVLTFNFAMEYIALGGETPLTEMPSFESTMRRTSVDQGVVQASYPWVASGEVQFQRIFLMFIPYGLIGSGGIIESNPWETDIQGKVIRAIEINFTTVTQYLSKFQGVVLGVVLSGACLIGLMFVRPRILFATLTSFGFFWTLLIYESVPIHHFESIYYIGLPLVFFTVVLLLARRLTKRDWVIAAAAVGGVALFAVSSFQMSRIGHSEESAQIARAAEQDILTIRKFVAGEHVTVLNFGGNHILFFNWAAQAMSYYLDQSLIRYRRPHPIDHGFIVMRERIDIDALITPQNRYLFLYDAASFMAWYRSLYRSVVATEPFAREEFNVYLMDGTVYYVKEPCSASNFIARFFLHVFPADTDDLPDDRREYGFDNRDFIVRERGLLFDGKCLASVDLPEYDIAGFRTGRRVGDAVAWRVAHVVQAPKLISEYPSIVASEPIGRSEFDLYLDGDNLYYVKEPCDSEDVQADFFVHIFPADLDDLPDARREYRFDKLTFGFDVRGTVFDDKCLASVDLPEYDIAGFRTGQDGANGARGWNIAHVTQAPKLISEYPSIVAHEPTARSEFDLYLAEGKLHYVKDPCDSEDVQAGFFLHIVPADIDDLPDARTEHGFDNFDFGFDVRGIVFDGKCVATVPLPQYAIAQITTGQYDAAGRIWTAEIVLEANE